MRKRPIAATPKPFQSQSNSEDAFDLEQAAVVEVTSEEEDFPIESALLLGATRGWRAAQPGPQTIRLVFDQPQTIKRISLAFEENDIARTQEFALRWSADASAPSREIVRQQWNFSPPATMREVEEYRVELSGVNALELTIVPNISGGAARASLQRLRLS
jgi:hypothetical protein